jgi:hypothetical protein
VGRIDRTEIPSLVRPRHVPGHRLHERLVRFGLEAERIRERLHRQLADRADRVLERRHHGLRSQRGSAARRLGLEREHPQPDVHDPDQRSARCALDQPASLLARNEPFTRPMMIWMT